MDISWAPYLFTSRANFDTCLSFDDLHQFSHSNRSFSISPSPSNHRRVKQQFVWDFGAMWKSSDGEWFKRTNLGAELLAVVDELTQTRTEKEMENTSIWLHNFHRSEIDVAGPQQQEEKKLAKIDDYISFNLFDFISVRFSWFQFVFRVIRFHAISWEIFLHIVSVSRWPRSGRFASFTPHEWNSLKNRN